MNIKPVLLLFLFFILLFILFLFSCSKKEKAYKFTPKPDNTIVFIGNTFALDLGEHTYLETLLYKSFPKHNLRIRNLAWSGDEVNLQPRPVNFGTMDEHLHQQQADVIFACFGLNEAFKGPDSVHVFRERLKVFLSHLQNQTYNRVSTPQIVLISPIAHETLGGQLPDPGQHNESLKLYTQAMQEVGKELTIPFINLYEPTTQLMKGSDSLTINGIHLTGKGYKVVSELMAKALDFPVSSWPEDRHSNQLKKVIATKNQHFFYKFKASNGEYIYGRRREWAGGQALPDEFRKIDQMVLRLDSIIWEGSRDATELNMDKLQSIISSNPEQASQPVKSSSSMLQPDKSQFILQEGYQIELFASEVDLPIPNPVAFTFDSQGKMWVATMPSYPHYSPGNPPNDKLIILEDTNGDGKADKHTVFADSLYLPLGFELGDGGVYVTQAPNFVFLKDTNGDGKADLKKTLLKGFGTEDSHHAISAYTWGPDGALYMHEGTFLHSQIETPYGPKRGANGITWRYEPRTMKLDPYISFPYANPWGQVFTRNGTHLIADVSTGMNYFAPPMTVAINYPIKHKQMKDFLTISKRPKTCGVEIVSSRHFPESAQGNVLFNTFIGFQGIKQHKVSEEGSGIVAHEVEPLLQSKDPNFRPVDLKFGPDGALYLLDWYDAVIQHGEQNFRDPQRDHTRGRIWRITYKDKPVLKPVDLTRLSVEKLLDELKVYEDRARYRTRIRLRDFPAEKVIPVLREWVAALDSAHTDHEYHKLEALWVFQQFNEVEESLLENLLDSKDHHIRAAATRVLFYWNDRIKNAEEKLITMSRDKAPRVRLEAIAALSHFSSEASVNALLKTTEIPTDEYIDYALEESFKHLKPVWIEMFKKDKQFLSEEPTKAERLLKPLASQKALNAEEYFVKDDPLWHAFSYRALSEDEYEQLRESPAVQEFRERYQKLSQVNEAPVDKTASGAKNNEIIIHLTALPGKMLFDTTLITIPAGKSVSLIFQNRGQMAHNVVIVKPGSAEKVGKAADAMAGLKDGYERNFVPDLPEVLVATPLINAGKTFQLDFKAPEKPGAYPFICSFPGHWKMMKGVLKVE
ncbi:azurin [Rhodocytophaga rosea]|uniref:Azurin n=1 Tax=Rhodocytophaga rosea TaxID=2704465 RepID=A0A6C0GHB6_9BACT|nr:PVC-type heme-binding CxxCH protein [Rhodocytophaga rosea]QHT67285.1 azurin [Rhodocytophaga rosea]